MYINSKALVVIKSFQGFSVDGALHSIPIFVEQGLLIDDLKAATILRHARQPEVDFLRSWTMVLNKCLGKSSP